MALVPPVAPPTEAQSDDMRRRTCTLRTQGVECGLPMVPIVVGTGTTYWYCMTCDDTGVGDWGSELLPNEH